MFKNLPDPRVSTTARNFPSKPLAFLTLCFALTGCMTASKHQSQLGSTNDRALTLGTVQKEVKVGMAQSDVAVALGSPNIVTGDIGNREVWIYDKVASEITFSNDSGSVVGNVSGAGTFPGGFNDPSGSISGNLSNGYSKSAGATSVSQRTLTVIVKFNADKTVESVSYNSTRF